MADLRMAERRLASGPEARVLRIDAAGFTVWPAFTEAAPEDETRLACALGQARLGMAVTPVPPAATRAAQAVEAGGSLRLAARALPRARAAAVAPMRLLRTLAGRLAPGEVLINANHFLFLPAELTGAFDAYGDPIGLSAAGSEVETPPGLPRACLLMAPEPAIRRVGFAALRIETALGPVAAHPLGPPGDVTPGRAFALFHGSVGGMSPPAEAGWDVACVGRHAVALAPAGGLSIPRAGLVLRLATRAEAERVAAAPLTLRLPGVVEGVQAGPIIVDGGEILGEDAVFDREGMRPHAGLADTPPPSPHAWAADWHKTRAARLSAGITAEGGLFFLAVEGTSSFFRDGGARGATLHDLAALMREEGAVRAMHLDGGGSTQAFCHGGGALLEPRDVHHGMPGSPAQFDRPLPLALCLR